MAAAALGVLRRNPLEGAKVTRLTDFDGAEHHAAISRDGKFVAFLSDRDGTWDAWATQVGTSEFHNLTKGSVPELRNPGTRTIGFHPDGSSVILWSRVPDSSRGGLVNAGWAVPTMGGPLRPYLPPASPRSTGRPTADASCTHPPTDGDPLFVTALDEKSGRQIYVARKGFHNHFPVWSHDGAAFHLLRPRLTSRGKRRLAHSPDRRRARATDVSRLARHLSNLVGQPHPPVPRHR